MDGPGPNPSEFSRKLAQITARAWHDEAFKTRLVQDPASVADEYGIPLPAGKQLRIVEDGGDVFHFVLPAKPAVEELSEEELQQAAGGVLADQVYSLLKVCVTDYSSTFAKQVSYTPSCSSW